MQFNYFLCVYEQKNKIRFVTFETKNGKKVDRQCSSCLFEKFNGFQIVYLENENKIGKKFLPIDIIYEPVSNQNDIVNCYFSDKINLSLVGIWLINDKNKKKWSSA